MKRIISIFVFAVLLLSLQGCGDSDSEYRVYYKTAAGDRLMAESRRLKTDEALTGEETVALLIEQLSAGPEAEGGINALPDGTRLLGAKLSGETAIVDLSKEYYNNRDVDELLARLAIVNTLCGVDGIEGVRIKVEGKPLVSTTTGAEIGVIALSDVAMGPQDKRVVEKETVILYFPDKDAEGLVAEKREIELQASLSVERLIISELAKGPESKELVRVIPSETKVIGTETKDGVCFVNLSGAFAEQVPTSSSATTMALYSIVNSLTELDGIDSVQILIDGKTGVEFGNYVLDAALARKKSLIKD